MSGKKKDELADFFGEDSSWFDDEEEGGAAPPAPPVPAAPDAPVAAAEPAIEIAVAPPPAAPEAAPVAEAAPEADAPRTLEEGGAPTLMFTADMLPVFPMPHEEPPVVDAPPASVEEPPAVASEPLDSPPPAQPAVSAEPPSLDDQGLISGLGELTGETTELAVAPIAALDAAEQPVAEVSEARESTEDFAPVLPEDDEVPMVQTRPAGASRAPVAEPAPAPEPVPAASPPPRPLATFVPGTERDDWRAAARALEAEAAHCAEAERAAWLGEAGRLLLERAGDTDEARRLLQAAVEVGATAPLTLRALADVCAAAGRWEEAAWALKKLAEHSTGAAAGDAWFEAAQLTRSQLGRPAAALDLLRRALAADSEHFAAASLFRDLSSAQGHVEPDSAAVLAQLAALGEGSFAADIQVERAQVLASRGAAAEAQAALVAAHAAAPGHGGAQLALQASLSTDRAALADHIAALAAGASGADAAWWRASAARLWAQGGRADAAMAALATAAGEGHPFAWVQAEAWATASGDAVGLEAALEAAAAAATGPASAYTWFRLGRMREASGRPADALAAYRAASAADPSAMPPQEGAARMLQRAGDTDAVRAQWQERARTAATPAEQRAAAVRVGELSELLVDADAARAAYAAAATEPDATGWVAIDALARLQRASGALLALAETERTRAAWSTDPVVALEHRWAAAQAVGGVGGALGGEASVDVQAILAEMPVHPGALDWMSAQGGAGAGRALEAAAASSMDGARQVALRYRAARVWAVAGQPGEAERLVAGASADGGALMAALADELGVGQAARARDQAARATDGATAAWAWLQAGDVADLQAALGVSPAPEALFAACAARAAWDTAADRGALWRQAASLGDARWRAWAQLATAEAETEVGNFAEATALLQDVVGAEVDGIPRRVAARLAERLGQPGLAARWLEPLADAGAQLERARLLERGREVERAWSAYAAVGANASGDAARDAAIGEARTAAALGDRDRCVRGHAAVARAVAAAPMRAAYASWAAAWLEEAGDLAGAGALAALALEARPTSTDAFDARVRALVALGDLDGVRTTFGGARPDDRDGLAEAFERAGATAAQVDALGDTDAPLHRLVRREVALARLGDWQGVYDTLSARRERTTDEDTRTAIDARRRWLLAEKLAETEQAWTLYRQLHLDAPGDRDVTEALARIAGARGEVTLAIQFLRELAESTTVPSDAARYRLRIGETCERNSDLAGARQAYLDALDHLPEDAGAIAGLKRIASAEGDWQGLVAVLQREEALSPADRRSDVRREIARITEANASAPALAMDAWRAVLDAAPQDAEALEHLYALAEGAGQWASVIEAGQALAERLSGAARGAALRRLGEIATQHLDPAQGVAFWEQAIVQVPPDVASAVHLEAQYQQMGDAAGTRRALDVQAAYAEEATVRVRALALLAQADLDRRDRDGAAARYLSILALSPEHPSALRFLATYLVEQQRHGEALPVLDALAPTVADGLDVDDPDVRIELAQFWCTLGDIRQGAGRGDDAVAAFEQVLSLNGSHAAALEALSGLFVARQDWSRAEPICRQWLQVIGTQADKVKVALAYTQLGFVERALQQRDKAEKRFAKALELTANFIPALKGQAQIAADKGDWNGLLNTYNTIIYQTTVPAEVIEAYMTKGRVLDQQMGRPDKAAQHYNRSLDFDPNQPGALALLGELSLRAGEFEAASGHFERGLALDASADQARVAGALWAGLAQARRGWGQEVGDALSRASAHGEAWGALASGSVEAACEAIRAAV